MTLVSLENSISEAFHISNDNEYSNTNVGKHKSCVYSFENEKKEQDRKKWRENRQMNIIKKRKYFIQMTTGIQWMYLFKLVYAACVLMKV